MRLDIYVAYYLTRVKLIWESARRPDGAGARKTAALVNLGVRAARAAARSSPRCPPRECARWLVRSARRRPPCGRRWRESASLDRARWRRGLSRTEDRLAAARNSDADASDVPSACSCMSLSRGQGTPQAVSATCTKPEQSRPRWSCRPTDRARPGSARRPRRNRFRCVERRQMTRRHITAGGGHRERRLDRARPRAGIRAPAPRPAGSLIDGPGNTSVRSAATLWVGAGPGSRNAPAGRKPT